MKKQVLFSKFKLLSAGLFALTCSLNAQVVTTFNFTGSVQTYTVPVGVTSIDIECWGAQGAGGNGGNGGYVKGTMSVTPGQVLNVYVGGQNGYNGGGTGHAAIARNGGGASDVRVSPYALADRVIVAGGGGGGGQTDVGVRNGGTGGGGTVGPNYAGGGGGDGYGGNGGAGGVTGGTGNTSCHSGGAGGGGFTSGGQPSCNTCYTSSCGQAGTLGLGGNGDAWENGICYTTYGGTNGGGGGYYGGGGSSVGNCGGGGGGGGSSYSGTLTNPIFTGGIRTGNGQVVITTATPSCVNPTYSQQPANASVCAGVNTSYSVTTAGATTWQWEVNTGSGFTTITNNATYSGATTQTLTISGVTTGMNGYIYRCTAADGACNTLSSTATLSVSAPVMTLASTTNNICFNGVIGAASVNAATGGIGTYTYDWQPGNPTGDGTTSVSGLTSGTYTCIVTDGIGCTTTVTASVTSPSQLIPLSSAGSIACNGGTTSVTVTASGGTSPYSGTGTFTATAGTYTYSVSDANGCISSTSVTVTEPSILAASANGTNPSTCGGSNGSADLTVTGGTSAYTFVWSNAATTEDLNGVTSGSYNCTITDANGCTTTASVTLNDPALPTVTYSNAFGTICVADAPQTLTGGSPSGGTYSGPGVTAGTFDPAAAGAGSHVITYTYTDGNSCTSSAIDTVTVDVCTGLNGINTSVSFTVMPNPNNGLFTLTLNSTEYADVYVYDATGKAIQSERMLANEKFDMTIETAGIYFITAVSADGTRTTQRVIVQK